jgi:hypothetical protein
MFVDLYIYCWSEIISLWSILVQVHTQATLPQWKDSLLPPEQGADGPQAGSDIWEKK